MTENSDISKEEVPTTVTFDVVDPDRCAACTIPKALFMGVIDLGEADEAAERVQYYECPRTCTNIIHPKQDVVLEIILEFGP